MGPCMCVAVGTTVVSIEGMSTSKGRMGLTGIGRRSDLCLRRCEDDCGQPGVALCSKCGGKGRGGRGGLSRRDGGVIYSCNQRELTTRIKPGNERRDLGKNTSRGGDDDAVWAAAVSEINREGVGSWRQSLGGFVCE